MKADDLTEADDPSFVLKQTILVKADDLFTFIFASKSRRSQPTYFGTNADDPDPERTILTYVFWESETNIRGLKQTILINNRGMKVDDPDNLSIRERETSQLGGNINVGDGCW